MPLARPAGPAEPPGRPAGVAKPRSRPSRRRSRIAGFTAVIVIVAAIAVTAVALANRGGDAAPGARAATSTEEIAAAWVDRQVGHDVIVASDPVMCRTLRQHGFPSSKLLVIKPSSSYPVHAKIVVETPAVQHQFGSSLATNVAPERLATFGSGPRQISVRIIASAGPAAYGAQLAKDAQSRRKLARYLLGSRGVNSSPAARNQLASGQVDIRLMIVLAALAADEPAIDIASFGPVAAGESAGLPLRLVNLSVGGAASPARRAALVRSLQAIVDHQPAPWHRSSDGLVKVAGKPYFQITFPAPTPLGLLPGGTP